VKTRAVVLGTVLLSLFVFARARAGGKDAATEKVTALNRAAVDAYGEGDFKKMKAKLQEAGHGGRWRGRGSGARRD
jgi:hypothetical protein